MNYNGNIYPDDAPVFLLNNRSLRYGDGLFESFLSVEGKIPLLDRHLGRLRRGAEKLKMVWPEQFSADFFREEIQKMSLGGPFHRIRLTLFRAPGGLYAPLQNQPEFLIEAAPLPEHPFESPLSGWQAGWIREVRIPISLLSGLKTTSSALYVLAGLERQNNGWDEGLLLNTEERVAEACFSNVFLWMGGFFLTPTPEEGGVAGIMREVMLEHCPYPVHISPVHPGMVSQAESLLLTNAIQGVRWIGDLEGKPYHPGPVAEIREVLREAVFGGNQ